MPLHVLALQPSLPAYRVPVFKELGARPGIDLHVCYSQSPNLPNAEPDGFHAIRADHRDLWFKAHSLVWQAPPKAMMRADWCDCLLLNWNARHLSLLPTMIKARAMRIPVVVWGHGFSKQDSRMRRWLRSHLIRPADAIVTYNHFAADNLVRAGIPRQRVFVALNSLDQTPMHTARDDWASRPDDLTAFRRQHGLDRGPVLLFCSRLEAHNRLDWLLDAAPRLREHHPHLKIVIVGGGPDEEPLKRHAARLGLGDSVKFVGPLYGEPALAPWFMSADAFVYPTNIGLSLLHALGYGLPVITSARFDVQNPEIEALVPGHNGLTFEHGSVDSLVSVVESLLGDRALRDRLARGAASQRRFTIPRMVDGLEAAIRYASRQRAGALTSGVTPNPA